MNNLFDISEKKAIVTGASRGLGKAMAQGLHDAGVTLVIMGTNGRTTILFRYLTGDISAIATCRSCHI